MDRTREYIRQAQEGNQEAKEMLLQENTGLIWSIVKRFYGRGYDPEDLYQIGAIGLLKCIDNFDFSYDVKFSTYAVPMIMGEIRRFCRDDGMLKVSRTLKTIAEQADARKNDKKSRSRYHITGIGKWPWNCIRGTFACIRSYKRCRKPICFVV